MLTGLIPSVYAAGPEPDVLTGTVEYYSTAKEERVTDEYTYSDAWFFEDPNERNDALALVSMQLTAATDGVMAVNFLSDLGFAKTGTVNYDSADPTDCSFTWGVKNVSDGSGSASLVAIAFQSYAEDLILRVEVYTNEDDVSFFTDEYGFYLGTVFMNGVKLESARFSGGKLISDDSVVEYLIVEIPFTPGEPQPAEPVRPESKPDPKLPVRIPVPENPAVPGDSRPEKAPVLNIPGQPAPQTGSTAPAAETPAAEEPVLPFTDAAADNV